MREHAISSGESNVAVVPGERMKVLVLHGVNLNMFGKRDPAHYGTATLADIDARLVELGRSLGVEVASFQTNGEKEMCERIHAALSDGTGAVVVNAGAWTHYSYAIRDALAILHVPIVEVHMSDIHAREPFRRISVLEGIAREQISGKGVDSYLLGLRAAVEAGKK
jgi:3-dehydroquinate dehydratase-2